MNNKHKHRPWIPLLISIAFAVYDVWFLFGSKPGRSGGEYIDDIRTMNQYLSYNILFLSVIMGLIATRSVSDKSNRTFPFVTLFVAILAALISLIFIPVPYNDDSLLRFIQLRWLFSLILEQTSIVFTAYGMYVLTYIYFDRQAKA